MALQHAAIFFTFVIFMWLILANAHATGNSKAAPLRSLIRPTRIVKQRAFQNYELLSARGYGKRIPSYGINKFYDKETKQDANEKQMLLTDRMYGKRAANMNNVNNLILQWMELESRMRNMGYPRSIRDDEILLPD